MESSLVSYITDSREVGDDTPVGRVIVNYLLETKSDPNANVVYRLDDDTYESLYSYDLSLNTLADIPQDHILLVRDTFRNPSDALISLSKLRDYLQATNTTFFEEAELLAKIAGYIVTLKPRPKKQHGERVVTRPHSFVPTPVISSIRNGLGNATPILTDVQILEKQRLMKPTLKNIRPVPSFVPSNIRVDIEDYSFEDDY